MATNKEKARRAGGAAGPSNASSLAADASSHRPENRAAQAQNTARRRRLVEHLHRLGPAPLAHFISDVERGAGIDATLERYGRLPAVFVLANRGDRFPEPMFAICGGRQ